MNKVCTKTLKMILFIGVFAYFQYHGTMKCVLTVNSGTAGVMMASAAYLIASLFGTIQNFTKSILIAIIGTGSLALIFMFKLDIIISAFLLSEELVEIILEAFALLCLIKDIITVRDIDSD